jgi:Tfp pilus assembly protein PilF
LEVQADVASLVAHSLIQELVPGIAQGRRADEHPAAYQAFLRGRYHWAKPGDSGLVESLIAFEEATRLAPDFAAAHGGLARVRLGSAEYYHELPRQALGAARESAARALELDPSVSEAVAVFADTLRTLDMDWTGAETGYAKALALNPSNEYALRAYGVMLALRSRFEEAAWHVDRACEIDPLCLMANTLAAWTRYVAGEVERAIERCRHALDLLPEFGPARRLLGATYLRAGESAQARSILESLVAADGADCIGLAWLAHAKAVGGAHAEARELMTRAIAFRTCRYVPPFHLAIGHVGLGDHDRAFDALKQAWLDRDPALASIVVEPRFDPLREDPRYLDLLECLNLRASEVGTRNSGPPPPPGSGEARRSASREGGGARDSRSGTWDSDRTR